VQLLSIQKRKIIFLNALLWRKKEKKLLDEKFFMNLFNEQLLLHKNVVLLDMEVIVVERSERVFAA
jgi:hypothetical protein